jgi:protein SPA2
MNSSLLATSQLFLQATPQSDDQLPVSPNGGVLDIHVTAFLSAIDSLLTAGRSPAPSQVLTPLRHVINAVTTITEDVQAFEERGEPTSAVDLDTLRHLRDRAEATLSNLVAAGKTHATSAGMAPVSLLDAAASHVSSTITEIGKAVLIRKATADERAKYDVSNSPTTKSVSFAAMLSPVRENGSGNYRSNGSSFRNGRPPSDPSSSNTSGSPPPIFDQTRGGQSSAASTVAGEDQWAELKVMLPILICSIM